MFDLSVLFLSIIGVFGIPLNIYFFYQLHCKKSAKGPKLQSAHGGSKLRVISIYQLLLKHLNASDLLVMLIHIPIRLMFRLTTAEESPWISTRISCSLIPAINLFIHHTTSNMVACIAVLRAVCVKVSLRTHTTCLKMTIYMMLAAVWLSSIAFACASFNVSQILVVRVTPKSSSGHNVTAGPKKLLTICLNKWVIKRLLTEHHAIYPIERFYYVVDQVTRFWIPGLIIVISYVCLMTSLQRSRARLHAYTGSLDPITEEGPNIARQYATGQPKSSCASSNKRAVQNMVQLSKTTLTYLICWIPYAIVISANLLSQLDQTTASCLQDLITVNSAINPLFYPQVSEDLSLRKIYGKVSAFFGSSSRQRSISPSRLPFVSYQVKPYRSETSGGNQSENASAAKTENGAEFSSRNSLS